jgi:hypothetical protein
MDPGADKNIGELEGAPLIASSEAASHCLLQLCNLLSLLKPPIL